MGLSFFAFACAAGVALLLVAVAASASRLWALPRGDAQPFFTGAAVEEPTRSYVPYTGTVPVGVWGAAPWAVAAQGP